jgi:plastocyanin
MNQKPLLYVLIATLVVVLAGFIYLNMSSQQTTTTTTGGKPVSKVTLPPEPESPRTFPTLGATNTGSTAANEKPRVAKMEKVTITSAGFVPNEVTISPGDLVTWTNNDSVAHKIKGKSWGSGSLASGKAFTQEFDVAGTFSYTDEVNSTFTGIVVIK